ncbi:hypothetical protein DFH11DRAFT_443501 [Phellopilus nigrolimitatus]|nr:hypothetical protein DFH11DRAFT_443501 [Phellopilus nigrolimitatus]
MPVCYLNATSLYYSTHSPQAPSHTHKSTLNMARGSDHNHSDSTRRSAFHGRQLPPPVSSLPVRTGHHAYAAPSSHFQAPPSQPAYFPPPTFNTFPPPAFNISPPPAFNTFPPPTFNPFPQPSSNILPQPPPSRRILLKVWVVDCKSCGTFFTNRGMKGRLLLTPHVYLYSTDALPVNCSVYHGPRSSRNTPVHPSSFPTLDRDEAPRSCDCLTQTLSCHGCGASVGYIIVSPCSHCASTFSPPPDPYQLNQGLPSWAQRTNGHRFIFHSPEVVVEERLYIPGEPDVIPDGDPNEGIWDSPSYPSRTGRPQRPHKVQKLVAGEVVWWHHLVARGDLTGMHDDERSRASRGHAFRSEIPCGR